jgi:hypothetical protein
MTTAAKRPSASTWGASRLFRVFQRVVIIVALLYVAVGAWSLYRAWFQVRSLGVRVVSENIRPGISAVVEVVTSGVAPADVRLELVQGTHAEMLATLRVMPARNPFFTPRTRQGTMMPTFTPDFLSHFQPGPAIVRATAIGRRMWLRTPADEVREISVVISAAPE